MDARNKIGVESTIKSSNKVVFTYADLDEIPAFENASLQEKIKDKKAFSAGGDGYKQIIRDFVVGDYLWENKPALGLPPETVLLFQNHVQGLEEVALEPFNEKLAALENFKDVHTPLSDLKDALILDLKNENTVTDKLVLIQDRLSTLSTTEADLLKNKLVELFGETVSAGHFIVRNQLIYLLNGNIKLADNFAKAHSQRPATLIFGALSGAMPADGSLMLSDAKSRTHSTVVSDDNVYLSVTNSHFPVSKEPDIENPAYAISNPSEVIFKMAQNDDEWGFQLVSITTTDSVVAYAFDDQPITENDLKIHAAITPFNEFLYKERIQKELVRSNEECFSPESPNIVGCFDALKKYNGAQPLLKFIPKNLTKANKKVWLDKALHLAFNDLLDDQGNIQEGVFLALNTKNSLARLKQALYKQVKDDHPDWTLAMAEKYVLDYIKLELIRGYLQSFVAPHAGKLRKEVEILANKLTIKTLEQYVAETSHKEAQTFSSFEDYLNNPQTKMFLHENLNAYLNTEQKNISRVFNNVPTYYRLQPLVLAFEDARKNNELDAWLDAAVAIALDDLLQENGKIKSSVWNVFNIDNRLQDLLDSCKDEDEKKSVYNGIKASLIGCYIEELLGAEIQTAGFVATAGKEDDPLNDPYTQFSRMANVRFKEISEATIDRDYIQTLNQKLFMGITATAPQQLEDTMVNPIKSIELKQEVFVYFQDKGDLFDAQEKHRDQAWFYSARRDLQKTLRDNDVNPTLKEYGKAALSEVDKLHTSAEKQNGPSFSELTRPVTAIDMAIRNPTPYSAKRCREQGKKVVGFPWGKVLGGIMIGLAGAALTLIGGALMFGGVMATPFTGPAGIGVAIGGGAAGVIGLGTIAGGVTLFAQGVKEAAGQRALRKSMNNVAQYTQIVASAVIHDEEVKSSKSKK